MIRLALFASVLFSLAACSSNTGPEPAKTDTAARAATAKQKTVLDDQLKAIDKAKGVEQQLQDEKEKHDKDIEANGG